jgi:Short C-terminal domain
MATLQELRDAGLLNQEEYETKRSEVINSIEHSRPAATAVCRS